MVKFPTFKDLGAEVFDQPFVKMNFIPSRDFQDVSEVNSYHSVVFLKKFKHSNVIDTCSKKGIPVIEREDLKDLKLISIGPRYYGVVCKAQWTRPDGIKVCGGSTYH